MPSFDDERARTQANAFPRVVTKGLRASPFEDVYHSVLTAPWWLFFTLVVVAFLSANATFAAAYLAQPGSIQGADGSFSDALFFSVQTMATIGYGAMSPATLYAHALVTSEALLGMLGMALVTGITFAKFARPTARVMFARKIVVGERDGVPHMMFRMANWRRNMILEAKLRVILLVEETTREGHSLRRPIDLRLVRDNSALFSMSWTAMHRIDETSPFYDASEGNARSHTALDRLRAQKGELFLSLNGLDETFAQTVYARCSYQLDDIVWGAHFVDVLTIEPDGTRVLDYSRFHEVVKIEA